MQVTASKVRVDFTRLLSQLSAGPVEITKHGKVVAVLVHPDLLATEKRADEPLPATETEEPTEPAPDPADATTELLEELNRLLAEAEEDGPVFPAESATG